MQSHTIADRYTLRETLGAAQIRYAVALTPDDQPLAPIMVCASGDRFNFQDYLTADEALTLARGLIRAATVRNES